MTSIYKYAMKYHYCRYNNSRRRTIIAHVVNIIEIASNHLDVSKYTTKPLRSLSVYSKIESHDTYGSIDDMMLYECYDDLTNRYYLLQDLALQDLDVGISRYKETSRSVNYDNLLLTYSAISNHSHLRQLPRLGDVDTSGVISII